MIEELYLDGVSSIASSSVALRNAAGSLTYGELNRWAESVSNRLESLGVVRGSAVAICLPRSFGQIVTALATMRLGAAYVPIDPSWPDERIQHIVSDSGAVVFVAPSALSSRISSAAVPLEIAFDTPPPEASKTSVRTRQRIDGDELAYIIYTSGSTGVPKGVEITHANLNHLIAWHVEAFGVTAADRATHVAGLGFDAAVWEIWPYISMGASVTLPDDMTRVSPALLQRWLLEEEITISFVPTPVAEPMLALEWPAYAKLRFLLTGGDRLHTAAKAGTPFTLVNNYGPTECTVVVTSGVVNPEAEGLPSIGSPITGTPIYLLDEQHQPVADGTPGEMYIGGDGVGRGYRNLSEQTAQAFLQDKFRNVSGARMYKTGDMAKRLPNGEISFLGRLDTQEKIRGNRIELEEIVSVLNRHESVTFNVVVTSNDSSQEKHLIAYVLFADDAQPTPKDLQEFASQSLPSYMVPTQFVKLSSLPLSANGKVDRSLLPEPCKENLLEESEGREPNSELEMALLALVRELLKTDNVNVEDDFFLIGGHSLLGTQLVLRARETFGVMLTLRDLFEASTVASLAAKIEELILEELNSMTEEDAVRIAAGNIA